MIDIANETILTIGEAAERLKVSKGTITNWIKVGTKGLRLEAIKFGSHWRTSEEALQRFGEQQTPQYEKASNLTIPRTSKQAQCAHQQAMDELDEAFGVKKCKTCKAVIDVGNLPIPKVAVLYCPDCIIQRKSAKFGDRLRAFRYAKQLPLSTLAVKTKISVGFLRAYEFGDSAAKPQHLETLVKFFGEKLIINLPSIADER